MTNEQILEVIRRLLWLNTIISFLIGLLVGFALMYLLVATKVAERRTKEEMR